MQISPLSISPPAYYPSKINNINSGMHQASFGADPVTTFTFMNVVSVMFNSFFAGLAFRSAFTVFPLIQSAVKGVAAKTGVPLPQTEKENAKGGSESADHKSS